MCTSAYMYIATYGALLILKKIFLLDFHDQLFKLTMEF